MRVLQAGCQGRSERGSHACSVLRGRCRECESAGSLFDNAIVSLWQYRMATKDKRLLLSLNRYPPQGPS
jgi:hypothetical protein